MIRTTSPAFEFLRKHKNVTEETEELVMRKVKHFTTQDELFTIFENGISGQYGKIYSLDPQTLIGWVNSFKKQKNASTTYLETGLLPITFPSYEIAEWDKEANKCLTSFLSGVSESFFHPCVYDRMMVDGKISINAYMKYFKATGNEKEDIIKAKQLVLRDTFLSYKSKGWTRVYFI